MDSLAQVSIPALVNTNFGLTIGRSKLDRFSRFAGYSVHKIIDELNKITPPLKIEQFNVKYNGTFYFTNEAKGRGYIEEGLSLMNTFEKIVEVRSCERKLEVAALPEKNEPQKIVVSCLVGESGLLSGLVEISDNKPQLIILLDNNPVQLYFVYKLFEKLPSIKDCGEYHELVTYALNSVKAVLPDLECDEEQLLSLADSYKEAFDNWHCFSSPERLEKFKEAADKCCIYPVCVDLFNKENMEMLGKALNDEAIKIEFLNVSNVYEYVRRFFFKNGFNGYVLGVHNSMHLKELPLTEKTICGYSNLCNGDVKSAQTCRGDVLCEKLYKIGKENIFSRLCGEFYSEEKSDEDLFVYACKKLSENFESCEDKKNDALRNAEYDLQELLGHISHETVEVIPKIIKNIKRNLDKNPMYKDQDSYKNNFIEMLQVGCNEAGIDVNLFQLIEPRKRKYPKKRS